MRIIISLHIQSKILPKSHVSTICFKLAKNWFLLIFTYIFNVCKFPRACCLYIITVKSYEGQWYSFWYQWIKKVHTYTLVANIGVSGFPYRKSREGLQQHPLRSTYYTKYLTWTRVKVSWVIVIYFRHPMTIPGQNKTNKQSNKQKQKQKQKQNKNKKQTNKQSNKQTNSNNKNMVG